MKQMTEAETEELALSEIKFDKKMADLKEKYKEFLTEDVVRHYSNRYRLSRDEAILKLCANFSQEESSTDSKQIALKAMGGLRLMSPKLNGMEQRQNDLIFQMGAVEKRLDGVDDRFKEVQEAIQHTHTALDKYVQGQVIKLDLRIKELEETIEKMKETPKKSWMSSILTGSLRSKKKNLSEN